MKLKHLLFLFLAGTAPLAGSALAQGSDSHTVTIDVLQVNSIALSNDLVTLTAIAPLPGQDFAAVTDDSTNLVWTTNAANRRIIVSTGGAAPLFDLSVEASGSTGTSAGVVAISSMDQDLITEVGKTAGSATLTYSIDPSVENGFGNQSVVVFYTLTNE